MQHQATHYQQYLQLVSSSSFSPSPSPSSFHASPPPPPHHHYHRHIHHSSSPGARSTFIPSMSTCLIYSTPATSVTSTTPSPPLTPEQSSENSSMTNDHSHNDTTTASPSTMSRQLYQPLSVPAPQFDVVNHPVKDTLVIVSTLLSILVHKNDSHYDPMRDPITLFHSRAVPRISIEAYLIRILQYIPFTNEVLLNVLVYLDRIGGLEGMQLQQGGALTSTTSSSTKTTGTTDITTAITMTKLMESSSTKNPEIYCSESSNSNLSLPVVQKRGRSEHEDVVGRNDDNNSNNNNNNNKRSRTESVSSTSSSSSCASVISPSTPVSTPPTPLLPLPSSNGFRINSFNIHRLLITCLMVAAKFTSDLFYSNARYAKVGGLSLPELNQLELEFLFTTKFELNVKVDELQRVGNALFQFRDRHMARAVQQQQLQQQLQQRQQQQQQLCLQMQMRTQCQQQYSMPYATPSPKSPSSISSEVISVPVQTTCSADVRKPGFQEQKTQLLSPPEEKHSWAESEVHETHAQSIDEQLSY